MAAAKRFRLPALRNRYIAAHGGLRVLLRDYYGISRDMQDIGTQRLGKPYLIGFPRLHYSVSYSGDFVMIGIGESEPVGVDIEVFRVIEDAAELMQIYFTAAEQAAVERTAARGYCRSRAFLEIWVRKEACVKACGCGLDVPLKSVECVSGDQMTTVQLNGSRFRTGALNLGDPIMAWSRRASL